jgi:large subunit ribosomal protein L17
MHRKKYRKLNMTRSHKTMMFRNMIASLLKSESGYIVTTTQKAKEFRSYFDRLITIAKKSNEENKLAVVRQLLKSLGGDKDAVGRVIKLAEKHKDRNGGYTRVLKHKFRHGDSAELSYIILV